MVVRILSGSPRELIFRLAAQRELQVGSDWKNFKQVQTTSRSELDYQYRVTCDKDYYGPGCSILCRPRDDQFGHYNCSPQGAMVCMQGWKGDYCDQGKGFNQSTMLGYTHLPKTMIYQFLKLLEWPGISEVMGLFSPLR